MKMNKELIKKVFIVLLILLIPAVFLTGCQSDDVNKQQSDQGQVNENNNNQVAPQTTESETNEIEDSNLSEEDKELIELLNALEEE